MATRTVIIQGLLGAAVLFLVAADPYVFTATEELIGFGLIVFGAFEVSSLARRKASSSLLIQPAVALIGGAALVGSGRVAAQLKGGASDWAAALPSLDLAGMAGVVVLVLPLAVLFAAVALTISLFARTQKEAQTYLAPLVAVVILPAVAGLLPGVELNATLALVPVLNVALACKDLVSGVWPWPQLALIFASTCVYAGVALAWCVRMFNRESVLFRS
jgi:sodium transport system permease protein